ncbi:MAG: glycosyltransferase family 4 protein [Planctomycetia bacterium]|nr:glycosyltransferase family 4 protein [Planctomycetia bacterium]
MIMSDAEPRVLLLAGRFEVRGSSAYTLRLATGLPRHAYAPHVITPDAGALDAAGTAQLSMREFSQLANPVLGGIAKYFLLRELLRDPPQLIHVQSHHVLRLGRWLARRMNLPYVLTVHEHVASHSRLPIDAGRCRQVIVVSESVRDDVIAGGRIPSDLVTVIPSGVDVETPSGLPLPLEPGHVPVIGTASPLEAVKGIPYFLGAARQVLDVRSHVEFLVAGAGPEEANLRRVTRELGITEKVTFVPNIRRFTDALVATDIFCLPSLQQGLGTTMLEAMALGRPVIATAVGGVASVIRDGQNGLVVAPGNSRELANKMIELLDNPPRARAIGNQARRLVVDEYNVATMVDRTVEVYRNALPM